MISLEGEKRQFKKMFHQMYRLHRSVITSTNLSGPVHDHDAANKLYVDRRSGGTDKVSRKGDTMEGDLDEWL